MAAKAEPCTTLAKHCGVSSGSVLPDCPVCWESYDLAQRLPCVIACGHTVCQRCSENLRQSRDFFGKKCISCPECRGQTVWNGPTSLPKNFALVRILREIRPETERQNVVPSFEVKSLARHLDSWALFYNIYNLASVISVLVGVLLGMLVFIPLCFVYVAVSWIIAGLSLFAFSLLSAAAIGFGAAGGLSFISYHVGRHCKVWRR